MVQPSGARCHRCESSGIYTFILQAYHIVPRLVVRTRIDSHNLLVTRQQIVRVQRKDQFSHHSQSLVRIGDFLIQTIESLLQRVVDTFPHGRPQPIARRQVERAASDQDQRTGEIGMRRGIRQGFTVQ